MTRPILTALVLAALLVAAWAALANAGPLPSPACTVTADAQAATCDAKPVAATPAPAQDAVPAQPPTGRTPAVVGQGWG